MNIIKVLENVVIQVGIYMITIMYSAFSGFMIMNVPMLLGATWSVVTVVFLIASLAAIPFWYRLIKDFY